MNNEIASKLELLEEYTAILRGAVHIAVLSYPATNKAALLTLCGYKPAYECVGFFAANVHCDHYSYLDFGFSLQL